MSEAAAPAGLSRLLSDERLTRRAVGGDERAFAAIFRRYHQSLYRFCLAIVGTPEDAQDALQNTMIKVLRALPGEERQIELKPWLYRIAHNESIDLLRRRRETRELDTEQVAPGHGLTEDVETRERLQRLIVDLKELPDRQREVLVMRELADLDFEEIGSALGTTGAVARQTLYEARQSLRQMEEGREMNCETVMQALSDGDGRVIRRRDVRAHLRSCPDCRSFRDEIKSRKGDFAALSPLPAVAAAGMLQGLLGGGSGAVGGGGLAAALGGGAAKTISASAAAKGVATVAAVAAVGVTAADRSGVIHVLPGGDGKAKSSTPTPGPSDVDSGAGQGGGAQGGAASGGKQKGMAPQRANQVGNGNATKEQAAPPALEERPPAVAKEHGKGHPGGGSRESNGHGPPAHAPAHGQEKQPAAPAEDGLETAEENKPPAVDLEPATEEGAPPAPPKPTSPSPPESTPGGGAPPKDPSAGPPGQAPQPPQQAAPQPKAETPAPSVPGEPGKGKGKAAAAEEAP